ncbi:MAG TPA: winged helix-turn-helix domain-containing protein [Candidatus Acidoferrales bacterium]|nr:winged helix-turn-helix domain-containing protein [Candidatus Acidoferrales bacterium]
MASSGGSILPQSSRPPKVAFGPFEFDQASGELRKHGYKVKLPGQPLEILSALIAHPGEVVTREDLRLRLWPGISSGDFEHGVNAAVNKLRQLLGDAASEARYIETLPGRGYRLVSPISPASGGVVELVPARAAPAPEPQPSRPRLVAWAGAGAALVALLVWVAGQRSPVSLKAARILVSPPKGYYLEAGGVRQSFALSPDGERIAFTAKDTSGAFRVFLRDFSQPESRPLADGEGAYSVVWSPDGQSLFFTSEGKLRRVGVSASVSQVVSNSTGPYFSSAIPFGSGRLLVCNHRNCGVFPLSGGPPQAIDQWYSWAQLLPGGRDFLYTNDDPQLGSMRARIAAIGGTEQGVEVVQSDSRVQYTGSLRSNVGYLVYFRAGTLLAQPFDLAGRRVTGDPKAIARHVSSFGYSGAADFSVSARGVLAYQPFASRSQFIWVDRTGKRLSAASPAAINASYLRLSPDGHWLATAVFDVERGVTDVWLYDTRTGTGRKAISGPGISHIPVWSPDSRHLVYVWDRSWPRLALSSLDGTPDPEPMPNTGFMSPTDWSPDGRFILYNNSALPAITQGRQADVFALDMARGRKPIPLLNTQFSEYGAVFSPDGKWLAFLSDESGKAEIYVQAIDRGDDSLRVTGERFLISRQGAQCLRWRKDARELYYLGWDGQVYAVSIALRPAAVHAGKPEALFTIEAEARSTLHSVVSFDVSGDGSRFVIPSITPGESSALVVLQDWESQVAKLK